MKTEEINVDRMWVTQVMGTYDRPLEVGDRIEVCGRPGQLLGLPARDPDDGVMEAWVQYDNARKPSLAVWRKVRRLGTRRAGE